MGKMTAFGVFAPAPPPLRDLRAAYYQVKAEECLTAAEAASDPGAREQLLALANSWSLLVWHLQHSAKQESDEGS